MVKFQKLNCRLWDITRYWPKLKETLSHMSECLKSGHLDSTFFSKLTKHLPALNDVSDEWIFKNVILEDGFIVVSENDDGDSEIG